MLRRYAVIISILSVLGLMTSANLVWAQGTTFDTGAASTSPRANHNTCLLAHTTTDATKNNRFVELHDTGDRCITRFPLDEVDVLETYDDRWILRYNAAADAVFNSLTDTVIKRVNSGRISIKKDKAWDVKLASGAEFLAGNQYAQFRPGSDYDTGMNGAKELNRAVILHRGEEFLHDAVIALTAYDFKKCTTCTWDVLINSPQKLGGRCARQACADTYQKACEGQVGFCKESADDNTCAAPATCTPQGLMQQCQSAVQNGTCKPNAYGIGDKPKIVFTDGYGGITEATGYDQNQQACAQCHTVRNLINCGFNDHINDNVSAQTVDQAGWDEWQQCVIDRAKQYAARKCWLQKKQDGTLTPEELNKYSNQGACMSGPPADGCHFDESGADGDLMKNVEITKYYDPNCECIVYVPADGTKGQSCTVNGKDVTSVRGRLEELVKCAAEGGFSLNKEIHRWSDKLNGGEYNSGLNDQPEVNGGDDPLGPFGGGGGLGPLDPEFGNYSPREKAIMPDPARCQYQDAVPFNTLPGTQHDWRDDCPNSPLYNGPNKPDVQNPLKCVRFYIQRFICDDPKLDKGTLDQVILDNIKDTQNHPNYCKYINRPVGCVATTATNGDSWTPQDGKAMAIKAIQDKIDTGKKCAAELYAWGVDGATRVFDTVEGGEFAVNFYEGAFLGNDQRTLPSILADCRYRGAGWRGDGKSYDDPSLSPPLQKEDLPVRDQNTTGIDGKPGIGYVFGGGYNDFGLCRFILALDDDKRIGEKTQADLTATPPQATKGCMAQFAPEESKGTNDLQKDIQNMKFNIIGDMLDEYRCIMDRITTKLMGPISHLFWVMVSIEMAWAFVLWNISSRDLQSLVGNMTQRILWIGMMQAVIQSITGSPTGGMFPGGEATQLQPENLNWVTLVPGSFQAVGNLVLSQAGGLSGLLGAGDSIWARVAIETLTLLGIMILDYFMIRPVDFIPILNLIHVQLRSFLFIPTLITILVTSGMVLFNYLIAKVEMYIAMGAGCIFLGLMGTRWTFNFFSTYMGYAVSTGLKILINFVVCYIYIKIMQLLQTTVLEWMAIRYGLSLVDITGITDLILYAVINLQISALMTIMSYVVNLIPRLGTVMAGATPGAGSGGELIGNAAHVATEGMTQVKASSEHAANSASSSGGEHGGVGGGEGGGEGAHSPLSAAAGMGGGGSASGGRLGAPHASSSEHEGMAHVSAPHEDSAGGGHPNSEVSSAHGGDEGHGGEDTAGSGNVGQRGGADVQAPSIDDGASSSHSSLASTSSGDTQTSSSSNDSTGQATGQAPAPKAVDKEGASQLDMN